MRTPRGAGTEAGAGAVVGAGRDVDADAGAVPGFAAAAGVGALAATGIVLEIVLVRVLSALLGASWVAPVLGAALLGGGLGAAAIAVRPALARPAAAAAAAAAAAILTAVLPLVWAAAVGAGAPAWALVPTLLTYALAGLALAATLARFRRRAAALVRTDLAAAATAATAAPLLLAWGGTGVAAHAVGIGFAAAAALLAPVRWRAPAAATALPALLLALATVVGWSEVDAGRRLAPKPIRSAVEGGSLVVDSVWDATARTDLLLSPDGARYLYLDGGAGSLVPGPDPARWRRDIGALAFHVGGPSDAGPASDADAGAGIDGRRALLIGTGGGLDIAQARAAGIGDVTAIEVVGAAVRLVNGLGARAGDVYASPTNVVVGDGRRALAALVARGEGPWDVITLAQVVLGAAEAGGAARTEQRLYTREAFGAALGALTPDGHLALKLYDEATLTRALTTALAALVDTGLAPDAAAALDHVFVALDTRAPTPVPLLVVRNTPFDRDAAVAAARAAEAGGWALLVVPGLLTPASLERLAAGEEDLAAFVAGAGDIDVAPTDDARPYFFDLAPGPPAGVGVAWLLAVTGVGGVAALALLRGRGRGVVEPRAAAHATAPSSPAARVVAAGALGTAFLLAELAALELARTAIGHPTWSLSVTLGAVLAGAALGAQSVVRERPDRRPTVQRGALVAALATVALLVAGPAGLALGVAWPVAGSAAAAALAIALAAVAWGVPFPRLLQMADDRADVAALWAASGAGAVVAAAWAVAAAPTFGLPAVPIGAVVAYGLAAWSMRWAAAQVSAQAETSSSDMGRA